MGLIVESIEGHILGHIVGHSAGHILGQCGERWCGVV